MIGVYDVHTIVVAVGKLNTEPLLIASQDVPKKDVPASLVGNSQIVFLSGVSRYAEQYFIHLYRN